MDRSQTSNLGWRYYSSMANTVYCDLRTRSGQLHISSVWSGNGMMILTYRKDLYPEDILALRHLPHLPDTLKMRKVWVGKNVSKINLGTLLTPPKLFHVRPKHRSEYNQYHEFLTFLSKGVI